MALRCKPTQIINQSCIALPLYIRLDVGPTASNNLLEQSSVYETDEKNSNQTTSRPSHFNCARHEDVSYAFFSSFHFQYESILSKRKFHKKYTDH